jgi:hypothetical protein
VENSLRPGSLVILLALLVSEESLRQLILEDVDTGFSEPMDADLNRPNATENPSYSFDDDWAAWSEHYRDLDHVIL